MRSENQTVPGGLHAVFEAVLQAVVDAARACYGERLVSLAVFGSVGRGTMRPDSDVDLLLVATDLPRGRLARIAEFDAVEAALAPALAAARGQGVQTYLAPIFKTPTEVNAHSPILLDMTEDARLLFDRAGFLRTELESVAAGLPRLGAKRHFVGNAWWWDLKPDFKPGDVVTL